jgi:UDP-N-acetylmuramate dehydrogenase
MALDPDVLTLLRASGFSVREQVPLRELGSFQLGGPARCVIDCTSPEEMNHLQAKLRSYDLPVLLIGEGTNILFSDEGWPGILVRSAQCMLEPQPVSGTAWRVSASVSLESLVDWAIAHSLSGLEPFVGIPGTVGGAVVGNAGAWGVQLADRLVQVNGFTPESEALSLSVEDCGFRYRDSKLKQESFWVSEVILELVPGTKEELEREKARVLSERASRHPDWRKEPCIGSFFKNLAPTSSAGRRQAAGWFLENAGAKACRVGGASVFHNHANILIKDQPECTAQDVAELASLLQKKVRETQGISLEREVRYLGAFPGSAEHPGFW